LLKLQAEVEEKSNYFEEIESLFQINTEAVNSVMLSTLEDLLGFIPAVEPEYYLDLKQRLLCFSLKLARNNRDSDLKMAQIKLCAETGYQLALQLHHHHAPKNVIEKHVLQHLEDCYSIAKLVGSEPTSSEIPVAWCRFFLSSCCNFVGKYGLAEEVASQGILSLRTNFRDNAHKHSVLAALYEVKATAHKYSGYHERAIKDYDIEIKALIHAQDISDTQRKEKLAKATEQIHALKSLFNY